LDARLVVALRHGLTATEGFFSVRRRHRSVWGCAPEAGPVDLCPITRNQSVIALLAL
jgi:hypothetical protein